MRNVRNYAAQLVRTAHRRGVKVLLSLGDPDRGNKGYLWATRPNYLPVLVSNLMKLVNEYGYDGLDLDWEANVNAGQFIALVQSLRTQLDALTPKGELTGSFWEPTWYLARMQNAFDQVNIMTYDECSLTEGTSWHNAALSCARISTNRRTVKWRLEQFTAVIDSHKLGLGLPFYGYVWKGGAGTSTGGVTRPGQRWTRRPSMRMCNYRDLIQNSSIWQDIYKHRDQAAGNAPFLSIDRPGSANDEFVTYDDEISLAEKVRFAEIRRLGGVMIWELSADYLPRATVKHPLLEAVKRAMQDPDVVWP